MQSAKKVNIYIYIYIYIYTTIKKHPIETLTKKQMIETKKYIYKNNKYIEMCTKIYPNIYTST